MPGNYQLSVDRLVDEVGAAADLGIRAFILFGIPTHKDATGLERPGRRRHRPAGACGRCARRSSTTSLLHHRRVLLRVHRPRPLRRRCARSTAGTDVDNDATLPLLAEQCVSHARAGADMIAPSGMMDGMVAAIRTGLDAAGFTHVPIMSYAAKYASGFYGPFRDAAEVAAAVRRPQRLPDGPGQRRRGAARSRARPGRGGRHRHGQAGPGVPRHHPPGQGALRRAGGGVQRQRRVRDGQGRGPRTAGSTSAASPWRS